NPLLTAQQLQQYQHPFVRTQGSEHADLLTQRTTNHAHPHAWLKPVRPRQLDVTATFPGSNLTDDGIRNVRRNKSIHDQANHTRRPPRIPPTLNHPNEEIARKQRRRDRDLAAMAAALLA